MKKTLFAAMGTLLVVSACSNGVVVPSPTPTPSVPVKTQQTQQPTQASTDMKKYTDDTNGITFDYPSSLSVNRSGDRVVVLHTVPFKHSPPCDFIGTGKELAELTDFDVSLEVYKKSLKDTAADTQDASFAADNMTGDQMKISEGFIEAFNVGDLKGYKLTQGVEGCGQYVYYFQIQKDVTLVATRAFVPELNSAISEDVRGKAEKLPGVILSKESDTILNSMLESFHYAPAK